MFKHLEETGFSYFSHLKRSLSISFSLMKASVCCAIHGIFPAVFCNSASDTVKKLEEEHFAK